VASYQRGVSFVVDDGYEDRARWPGTGRSGAGRRQQSSKAAKQHCATVARFGWFHFQVRRSLKHCSAARDPPTIPPMVLSQIGVCGDESASERCHLGLHDTPLRGPPLYK